MRLNDWEQRQLDIKMSEQMDREEEGRLKKAERQDQMKHEGYHLIETADMPKLSEGIDLNKMQERNQDIPVDVNYFLTRLQGQLVRLAEVNTKGRHVYSDEDLHKEIASIINTAQSFATQLRSSFDRKRFDVA